MHEILRLLQRGAQPVTLSTCADAEGLLARIAGHELVVRLVRRPLFLGLYDVALDQACTTRKTIAFTGHGRFDQVEYTCAVEVERLLLHGQLWLIEPPRARGEG